MIVRNGLCFCSAKLDSGCCSLVNVFHLNVCVVFIVISLFYSAWN